MYETEKQKLRREERERKEKEQKEQTMTKEREELKSRTEKIIQQYSNEINQISRWTRSEMDSVVFDSDICQWSIDDSTFDKHIFDKEKVALLIETETGIRYGGFVYSMIDKYRTIDEEGKTHGIEDPQSFLFSFKDNKSLKYDMREDKKNKSSFFLYKEDDTRLFVFGKSDIWVGKKEFKACCKQNEESYYDYQGNEKALTGITGLKNTDLIDIKRVIVLQFIPKPSSFQSSSMYSNDSSNCVIS